MTKKVQKAEVLIVGAGIAGLTAAYRLSAKGYNVTVLEAHSCIGGRVHSLFETPIRISGTCIEAGKALLDDRHTQTKQLIKEVGLVYTVVSSSDGVDCITQLPTPSEKILKAIETLKKQVTYRLEKLKDREALDRIDLREWILSNGNGINDVLAIEHILYRHFMSTCDGHSLLSFLYLLQISDFSFKRQKTHRVMGGMAKLTSRLSESIGRENIVINSNVKKITQTSRWVKAETEKEVFQAKYLVLAINPLAVREIEFVEPLPQERVECTDYLSAKRDMAVIFIEYLNAFWKGKGLSGCVESLLPYRVEGIEFYPQLFDASCQGSSEALLGMRVPVAFFRVHSYWKRNVIDILHEAFPNTKEVKDYLHVYAYNWSLQEYFPGVVVYPVKGYLSRYDGIQSAPIGRIYFCGAEYSDKSYGSIEGAVITGENVSKELIGKLK